MSSERVLNTWVIFLPPPASRTQIRVGGDRDFIRTRVVEDYTPRDPYKRKSNLHYQRHSWVVVVEGAPLHTSAYVLLRGACPAINVGYNSGVGAYHRRALS